MMEGTYFFGEHLRWNLGWNNPNPAGAFIATLIPWLWGLGRLAAARRGFGGWLALVVVLAELALWFLLCKTYSRGALVAVGVAGGFWIFAWIWGGLFRGSVARGELGPGCCVGSGRVSGGGSGNSTRWPSLHSLRRASCVRSPQILSALRLAGIGMLLWLTGFLGRIEPGYVSQDASAGNRLVLWKGGLQMIATSPWKGWGRGESGNGFMQWFQPFESNEAYAGMVNSYLHVAVERGLPVLLGVLVIVGTLLILALPGGGHRRGDDKPRDGWDWLGVSAGTSLVAFLAANVFSTLWIFRDLWWVVAAAGMLIVFLGFTKCPRKFPRRLTHAIGHALLFSVFVGTGLYGGGQLLAGGVRVTMLDDQLVALSYSGGSASKSILLIPDSSVLGSQWGKEIRRMAADPGYRDAEIFVSSGMPPQSFNPPDIIIVCGDKVDVGISTSERFPAAALILVHPVGRPNKETGDILDVTVLLPGLDTKGSGRVWRKFCKMHGWKYRVNVGVGQDVRLLWPQAIAGLEPDDPAD